MSFLHFSPVVKQELPANTFLVFGKVVERNGKETALANHLLDHSSVANVKARLLAVFPQIERFTWIIVKKTRDEILDIPSWVERHALPRSSTYELRFKEGEKVQQKRVRLKVKKALKHDGKEYKRGSYVSLLATDPRISEYKAAGFVCIT